MNPVPLDLSAATAPVCPTRPHTVTVHEDDRSDPYFWLREKGTPEVTAYLEAENAYTDAVFLKPTETLRETLYNEILARIQETDLSVPYPDNGYLYYTRTEEGKQYSIHCRRKAGLPEQAEQITLDLNVLAENESFLSVGTYTVSDDTNLLAFTTDTTGFREYTLRIKNLQTGELLPDTLPKVDGAVWSADGKYVFYVTEDETKRPYRVFRHTVGEPDAANDVKIYEESDGLYRAFLYRSRDRAFVFIGSASSTSTEYHYLRADDPTVAPILVLPREEEHEYYLDHRDGLFYIRTNKNALNFRLVTAPIQSAGDWTEILAHRPDVMLEDLAVFARHLVIEERENGLPRLVVRDLATTRDHVVTFPEPTYALQGESNREFDTDLFRYRYASLVTPGTVYDYNMVSGERTLLKETPVLGDFDRTKYISEYRFATAEDGTQIPVSLVRRKDTPVDGSAPCLLYGYGSYGIAIPATFQSSLLSLLDRGFVFAIGHIRGGGEVGKPWHNNGKMKHKMNTFTDFIACADYLVAEKYTTHDKLAIRGGSAGGLLMGAVTNLRPDLAKAVVSLVPFVDVLNTMLDESLPLTVGEYIEWGNPHVWDEYEYMKTYCPYTNLEAKAYPPTLLRTSLNDSQVMYWEPAKYIAKLRTLQTNDAPLLLHTNMAAGHGGSSGRYDALKELAMDYAFVLSVLGIEESKP
ncbi:MAG: S9 family peptidase [Akkermansiaceae bacterium]|nr:S9 family peptidase [Armatimonadota bacterium]